MSRREIKKCFEDMGLTYHCTKHSKNESWSIPGGGVIIKLKPHFLEGDIESGAIFSSKPGAVIERWKIEMFYPSNFGKDTFLCDPKEGLTTIGEIIYRQFEKQFDKPDYIGGYDGYNTWAHSSHCVIVEDPKPVYRPSSHKIVSKVQKYQSRPRHQRSSYAGKR